MRIAWISYDFLEYSALHVNALSKEHEVLAVLPKQDHDDEQYILCLLYTSPSPRDQRGSRMPSSA